MMILKDNKDSLVTHCETTNTVTKQARAPRSSLLVKYLPRQLIEREARALNILEPAGFAPTLLGAVNDTLTEQSFSGLPSAFMVPELATTIIASARAAFDEMESLGVLKIGVHHSEILWDDESSSVRILDYGEVIFADEFPHLRMAIKIFNMGKLNLLKTRIKFRNTDI